jgi:HEAT repeat protein
VNPRRRQVVLAGHGGDVATARAALSDSDPHVRELALGACARLGALTDDDVAGALRDADVGVRRRAAEVAATRPLVDLREALHDSDPAVVEQAAWSCGEHGAIGAARDDVLDRLIELAQHAEVALVRESAVAALGALGDERGLPSILHGCSDVPAVRRRAVLALAPFDGDEVEAALSAALGDRDWQVRQAAEDLSRIARG